MDYILPCQNRIDTLANIVKMINKSEQPKFDILVICNSTNHCGSVHSRIDSVSKIIWDTKISFLVHCYNLYHSKNGNLPSYVIAGKLCMSVFLPVCTL